MPYPPGGPLDTAARALADRVKEPLGIIIVENRPGAGGNLGVDQVAKSPPDGYSLVIGAVATHAVNPWLFSKLPYDPIKDFAPITLIAHVPNVLVMTPERADQLGIRSARDLIDYARKNPGRLNYASGGNGSAGHMAGELMKSQAKISAVHIPYAGAAPAQLGLLAGQTDFMFDNLASATTQIKAGKLRALAVTTSQRASSMPEVPTMADAGLTGLRRLNVVRRIRAGRNAGTDRCALEQRDDRRAALARDARAAGANGRRACARNSGAVFRAVAPRAVEVSADRQVLRRARRLSSASTSVVPTNTSRRDRLKHDEPAVTLDDLRRYAVARSFFGPTTLKTRSTEIRLRPGRSDPRAGARAGPDAAPSRQETIAPETSSAVTRRSASTKISSSTMVSSPPKCMR